MEPLVFEPRPKGNISCTIILFFERFYGEFSVICIMIFYYKFDNNSNFIRDLTNRIK